MIQRIIGGAVGALVVYGILWWNHVDSTVAVTAAIAGAVAAFFWPIIVGWLLIRRRKNKRDDQIQNEVARQMADQNNQGR